MKPDKEDPKDELPRWYLEQHDSETFLVFDHPVFKRIEVGIMFIQPAFPVEELRKMIATLNHPSPQPDASMVTLGRERREWQPMNTAPKGGGADRTDDPKWINPPKILAAFKDGSIGVVYWDWYYAPGGMGYTRGFSAWIGADSGEQVARFDDDPVAWMPLPSAPQSGSQPTTSLTEEGAR